MGNGAAMADQLESPLAVDVGEAIGRLLLTSSDRSGTPRMIFLSDTTGGSTAEAVILWPNGTPLLADVAHLFEHFGLRVADRDTLPLPPGMSTAAALHKFTFQAPRVSRRRSLSRVSEAFEAQTLHGFEIDDFAKLIVAAGLSWRAIVLIRAASRFVRQAGLGLSESYVIDTLLRHTEFAESLVHYFGARFDPDLDDRDTAVAETVSAVREHLDAATTLDEDRIMRSLESFVTACLRTNWYQTDATGTAKPYASFTLDSSRLALTGPVVPYREIYVYANDVEGIHLRSGAVARGGLRFSDRPEDYRTEVLGLMKTQTVKNSPIVPVGAKGAFVRKNPNITPAEAYTTFIRGLLDVTDNIVDGHTIAPQRTVTYDGPDTYLVVAADKGTASFSDLANNIALDAGYWLGDAFASGGSTGYDHKAMGITARGAWVSVRRHLDELDVDVDTDPFTVVGVGDMSGDVFGNGMLLSESIKLVAAFDHRHIFIDPDPDPARAFAERQRLFTLPGTTWDHYDRNTLSAGAGIWPRTAKRISLSPEAQKLLGVQQNLISPNDLIKAILSARVDLLWNGGIGTYVKASTETHADAADPVNDSVRVDAAQLRCAVIGEGGNLGLTQRARIEYALGGGRINADFIDNAAGVATSDLEVNLKIALDGAVRSGRINHDERNALLSASRRDVADAVLCNSESQTLAISLASSQAPQLLNRHERLIDNLEHTNGINRATEVLPTKKELVSRTQAGLGLTRPEIAILLAQSKNVVQQDLLNSSVPDEPVFAQALSAYFPPRIREQLSEEEIRGHRLAREIVATKIADDLINHVGPGLIYQLDERLGVTTPAVARAYAVVRAVFDIDELWSDAEQRTDVTQAERWNLLRALQHFIEHTATWILRRRPAPLNVEAEIDRYRPSVRELVAHRPHPTTIAETTERLRFLGEVLDLIETARHGGCPVEAAAAIHARTDSVLGLTWLTGRLEHHVTTNWWDAMAAATVRDDLAERHHALVGAVLDLDTGGDDQVLVWQERTADAINRFSRITAELRRDGVVDVSRACTAGAELNLLIRSTRTGSM
ncbi:glutamate dehydrogenase [Rhodococcus wratislaviensis]|uniref:NAD-dependent glutamate dehydrogenase n=1 Tax=Rhodococcus wratislaviensis TaxID=44752 RepID=A0AB38FDI3_RHOWR|nr:NAD-glutamate dehydrogenase domain-containing protein [Rhodococcus wratislaviensis]REE75396.1 glutamate dehydrogenase [Rhodococcus wratislaviensis]SPZ39571.1 NAD-dependent glutamate dehydrogenase [Rhodococcus wratislaviensis]